jgi:hypothetical protein
MKPVPKKSHIVAFKVTPEQYRLIEQRVEKSGMRLSTWIRDIALQVVRRRKPDSKGYLRIREPDGTMT